MNLVDWLGNRWITEHQTSQREISDISAAIKRNLSDCTTEGLSADGRMAIAYTAMLKTASAALAATGYRASREQYHYRVIQSLAHTIGLDSSLLMELDGFIKKRNLNTYESMGNTSDFEADRMIDLANTLHDRFLVWLRDFHPELI
jgi:hypothetical protein